MDAERDITKTFSADVEIAPPESRMMVVDADNVSHTVSTFFVEMESESGKDEEMLCSVSKVFGNEMLLEIILTKTMLLPDGKLAKKDVFSLRGVNRLWLKTVSDILRKRREPLHELTLTKVNSRSDMPYCIEKGKLLAQFVSSVAGETPLDENIPTFSLKLDPEFFRRENHKDLSECLTKCGSSLISLDLAFPVNSTMVLLFQPFTLPKLQRLTVQFSDVRLAPITAHNVQEDHHTSALMNSSHTVYPLQTILNETNELQELNLRQISQHLHPYHLIPVGFEYLNLPSTITRLLLDSPLRTSDLTLLLKNDLPNLIQLRLFASQNPYDKEVIHEILTKYRAHLRILNLRGVQVIGPNGYLPKPPTMVRFPEMKSLEVVTITSQLWQLDGENENIRWDKLLPELKELRLLQHHSSSLRKWANTHAMSASLKRLFVSVISRNDTQMFNPHLTDVPAPLTLEMMQGIHLTMPFLTCLEITVCGENTCALKYLFMEMVSLQKLAISVKGNNDNINPVHWDALLVGIPHDVALSLRRNPSFWDSFDLKDNYPSIRKLTELKSLALVENFLHPHRNIRNSSDSEISLISDMVFHFALFKMPALKYLLLSGRFKTSSAIADKWKEQKGVAIHTMRRS